MRPRRALTRVESAELFERRQQLRREAMTAEEIDTLMRKTIEDCLDRSSAVTAADLRRANVPAEAITMHFGRIMREVIIARKKRGVRA